MTENEKIAQILNKAGIIHWGVADFSKTLPLLECRAKARLPQLPKSVIVCLLGYFVADRPHNISRYAWCRDYHRLAQSLLEPVVQQLREEYPCQQFAFFTDNSPIREVWAAYLAGLGFVGKNGLLIHETYGSYHFIAEIVTDLVLEEAVPIQKNCGDCRRCLDACPLGALSPGGIEKSFCRSHISQKKGELEEWEQAQLQKGKMVWGCDICSDVCPYNQALPQTDLALFREEIQSVIDEENLSQFLEEKAFSYRGEKVLRRNLHILERIWTGTKPDAGE